MKRCSTSLTAFGAVSVLGLGCSPRCVVVSPCFNLHFYGAIGIAHNIISYRSLCSERIFGRLRHLRPTEGTLRTEGEARMGGSRQQKRSSGASHNLTATGHDLAMGPLPPIPWNNLLGVLALSTGSVHRTHGCVRISFSG